MSVFLHSQLAINPLAISVSQRALPVLGSVQFGQIKALKGDVDYFEKNRENGLIVVGASSKGMTHVDREETERLIQLLNQKSNRSLHYVTGGSTGMMQLAAQLGRAIGVGFEPLNETLTLDEHDAFVTVDGLGERMDAFNRYGSRMLALPGGFGTITEILFQLHQIFSYSPSPDYQDANTIVLFDPSHSYAQVLMPFIQNWMVLRQYPHAAQQHVLERFKIAHTPEQAAAFLLEANQPQPVVQDTPKTFKQS